MSPAALDPETHTRSYSANVRLASTSYFLLSTDTISKAYYTPNAGRPNLVVVTGAEVTCVNTVSQTTGVVRATGVSYIENGVTKSVSASKEVILCAGYVIIHTHYTDSVYLSDALPHQRDQITATSRTLRDRRPINPQATGDPSPC